MGRLAGVELPIVSLEHHYVVTEPVEVVAELDRELPVLRDPEGSFYARQEGEALLVGPFEAQATPWALDGVPEGFHGRLLPARLEVIEDVLLAAARRIPAFEIAGLRTLINGPDGYTPDGRALIGPVPGVRDLHVIAGFSIFGIVFGGGAGAAAADWILDGEPSDDMSELDVRRFGDYAAARQFLIPKALEAYQREYAIEFPFEERPVAQTAEDLAAVRPSARARRRVRRALGLGAAGVVPQRPRGRARGVQLPESQLARSRQGRV